MHTEIVAYYGGGGGSGWGGLALNPGAVSWEERRACCTLCTCQNSQEFRFFRKTSHILFFCVLNINYYTTAYFTSTTFLQHSFTETAHIHYFCLGKAPEPVQNQNLRDKDVAIGDLVGLGASEVAISRYGIVIF